MLPVAVPEQTFCQLRIPVTQIYEIVAGVALVQDLGNLIINSYRPTQRDLVEDNVWYVDDFVSRRKLLRLENETVLAIRKVEQLSHFEADLKRFAKCLFRNKAHAASSSFSLNP